jgi:hypothetical protein
VAVSSLKQDQSEWQIECQNRAREGLSRACECSRVLVFFEVSAVYLCRQNLTGVHGREKVYGSIP